MRVDRTGRYVCTGVTLGQLFNQLEERYGVIIRDESELKGVYDLSWPDSNNFEDVVGELNRAYGLTLSRERAPCQIYRVALEKVHSGK